MTKEKMLTDLLLESFDGNRALQRWLQERPGGLGLIRNLPSPEVGVERYFHEAVWGMRRRGMIAQGFFDALVLVYTAPPAALEGVAAAWGAVISQPSAAPESAAPDAPVVRRVADTSADSRSTSPRVFISYSWEGDAHKARVLKFANRLRSHGVDAHIDQYEQAPSEGWVRWMQNQMVDSDYVVLICTETYRRRFEGRETAGKGQGVTWEGHLANIMLYESGARNIKLVPVLLEGGSWEHVPLALRAFSSYQMPGDYDQLYRQLTQQPAVVKAPLGELRILPPHSS